MFIVSVNPHDVGLSFSKILDRTLVCLHNSAFWTRAYKKGSGTVRDGRLPSRPFFSLGRTEGRTLINPYNFRHHEKRGAEEDAQQHSSRNLVVTEPQLLVCSFSPSLRIYNVIDQRNTRSGIVAVVVHHHHRQLSRRTQNKSTTVASFHTNGGHILALSST